MPEAAILPSGEKAQQSTQLRWPLRVAMGVCKLRVCTCALDADGTINSGLIHATILGQRCNESEGKSSSSVR
jgi:hypothetical protein